MCSWYILGFQKAFDVVYLGILLDKLHYYGIRGIAHEWFVRYLPNRRRSVLYNGHDSELNVMRCGVLQGSILGPMLFHLNIDKTKCLLFMPKDSSHCADHIVINQTRMQEVKEKLSQCYNKKSLYGLLI